MYEQLSFFEQEQVGCQDFLSDEGNVKFKEVAKVFDQIEQVSGRLKITKLLADLLKIATPKEASIISYLSLGRLHPPYIGTQFQMAEKNLIEVIARLTKQSSVAVKQETKRLGDIGSVLEPGGWQPNILSDWQSW